MPLPTGLVGPTVAGYAINQHIECNMVKIMENKTKVGDVPNVALEEIHKKGVRIGYVLGLVFAAFAAYITHVMG